MKKTYLLLPLFALMCSSCFEDEGNYTYTDVEEITIEGIDSYYANNSYNGEFLQVKPEIKTNYADLEYEWYLWDPQKEGQYTGWVDREPYEAELISTEKNLNYEVNLPLGQYKLMLKVTSKSNGYFQTYITTFESKTLFTRGFYILKESVDGNSELDLYNQEGELMTDLITLVHGKPLEGKPRCLSTLPGHGKVVDNEILDAHSVCVTTEADKIAFYETESFSITHDESDVILGPLAEGEKPYMAFSAGYGNCFISSKGQYMSFCMPGMMQITGQFSIPATTDGGSMFVYVDTGAMGLPCGVFMWSDSEHAIRYGDTMNYGQAFGPFDNNGYVTEDKECLMCGYAESTGLGYFLLKDAAGKQYLYSVSTMPPQITNSVEIPEGSKLTQATEYAVNARTTSCMYFVYDNKVYMYDLVNYKEDDMPLNLEGISAEEEITYLAYHYQDFSNDTENNYTHLVVGTQQGNTYRLYMYNLLAGEPNELVRTIKGEGKLKMCAYMSSVTYGNGKMSIPN